MSKSKLWESISKSSDKEWNDDKKVHLSSKDYASFSEISIHRAVASSASNLGDWIWWTFRNRWLNVADGVVEET